ncbi:MAG: phospholipase D family protein [Acidiferrobacter sp.]
MKLLTKATAIRTAIRAVKPSRIAVAYVGAQWRDYVAPKDIEEIIVSPTLGSNPYAIRDLMKALGDDKVHFLNTLHAKIYLGAKAAVVGSCNLSQNGLGDKGREEAAVQVTDAPTLRALEKAFSGYKAMAQAQYRTRKAKEKALEDLTKKWHIAVTRDLVRDDRQVPSLTDYAIGGDGHRIHVSYYYAGEPTYNITAIQTAIPGMGNTVDDYISDSLSFLEEDAIEEGDWILTWSAYRNGLPRTQNDDMGWMYVHHVVPGGAKEGDETKLAIEAAPLKKPKELFVLDSATKKAVREVLATREFPALHPYRDDRWELAPADAVVPAFLAEVKKQMRASQRTTRKGTRKHLKKAG